MRIARFTTGDEPRYAIVDGAPGEEELVVLTGDPMYTPGNVTGERIKLTDNVRLLAPVIPRSKAVCLGKNYAAHAEEMKDITGPVGDYPIVFLKPNTAVVGPDDPIVLPAYSQDVQMEAELAIVIGRMCKDVLPEHAEQYIYGYTCANDVTARDVQRLEGQWFRGKAFDTSLPIGPWIETELDTEDGRITGSVNGTLVQDGNLKDMINGIHEAVAIASEVTTLLPGDLILTGTPAGVTTLQHGDIVEVEIEGLGTLRNPAIRR